MPGYGFDNRPARHSGPDSHHPGERAVVQPRAVSRGRAPLFRSPTRSITRGPAAQRPHPRGSRSHAEVTIPPKVGAKRGSKRSASFGPPLGQEGDTPPRAKLTSARSTTAGSPTRSKSRQHAGSEPRGLRGALTRFPAGVVYGGRPAQRRSRTSKVPAVVSTSPPQTSRGEPRGGTRAGAPCARLVPRLPRSQTLGSPNCPAR